VARQPPASRDRDAGIVRASASRLVRPRLATPDYRPP
jgi:hypothetical protein